MFFILNKDKYTSRSTSEIKVLIEINDSVSLTQRELSLPQRELSLTQRELSLLQNYNYS